jgi:bacillolysin
MLKIIKFSLNCSPQKIHYMKYTHTRLLTLLCIVGMPIFSFAQKVHTGNEAYKLVRGAEIVRESNLSPIPSFIKFQPGKSIELDQVNDWYKSAFKLDAGMEFRLIKSEEDKLGYVHHRFQQYYKNQPIEAGIWIAHTFNDKIVSFNGLAYNKITTPTTASLTEEQALTEALNHVGADTYKWQLPGEEEHLKWETEDQTATYFPKGELVYVSNNMSFHPNSYRLAYKFNIYAHQPVSRANIYVDANNGEIIRSNSILCHADEPGTANTAYSGEKDIIADSFAGKYRLRDASRGDGVRTFDMNEGTDYGAAVDFEDADNYWDNANPDLDEYATDAHWGAEMTYDYFFLEHGRNSIDNDGFRLNSYVHYAESFANAFWDGNRMTYGDGDGFWSPLTSIDIAGHEITHGLTTFTAGLIYAAESGALNESFSDIFGNAVEIYGRPEESSWLIGEDIGSALRSMANPNSKGDPDTYFGDLWKALDGPDSGGVHSNSGVQNFWFYLLTEGGSGTNDNGDDYEVESIGIENAGAVAFRNLTVYLTPSSNFADARFFAIQSAIDLFGNCEFEVQQTANAWYAVGVGDIYNPEVVAEFEATETTGCAVPYGIIFNNLSNNATEFTWDFGDGGTSTGLNPEHIYTEEGTYSVTLIADGGECGIDTVSLIDYITIDAELECIVTIAEEGVSSTRYSCEGTLFDSGGEFEDYAAGSDGTITIAPYGALSVNLNFPEFDVEAGPGVTCDYDYLEIFDGPDELSPLIGRYCNNNLPEALTSSSPSVTIVFHSDGLVQEAGFQIDWTCNIPEEVPAAVFDVNTTISCTGEVQFLDYSTNAPVSWAWDFGDGETSSLQNPTHTYAAEGTYTVTLTATNLVGSDEVISVDYITVEYPSAPLVTEDEICPTESATLAASGEGEMRWYDAPVDGELVYVGDVFNTPELDVTTNYYVEADLFDSPEFVGPTDNSFGGGSSFDGDQHLVFSAASSVILKSVKVYATGNKNRTIQLRDNTGTILESKTVYIESGEQTVELGFEIPAGSNYQLGTAPGSAQSLFRNNSGVPAFPYELPGQVTITTSSAGNDYYYFFYNWEIQAYTCVSERVATLATVLPASETTIEPVDDVCLQSGAFSLSASDAGGTWTASCDDCIDSGSGVFDPASSGTGSFEISYDIEGTCSFVNTITVNVVDCLGLTDITEYDINIYPNPTDGQLNIQTGELAAGTILITDVVGKTVAQYAFNSKQFTYDITDISARGTYFIHFTNADGQYVTTKKILKQ